MKRFVSIVLALIMVFSFAGTAFAAQDFVAGEIVVRLKSGITVENGYEELFPELDLERVVEFTRKGAFGGTYTNLVLVLEEKTEEATLAAVELLAENTSVSSAIPNTHQYYVGDIRQGDADRDGFRSNSDLIFMARSIVGNTELSAEGFAGADINGDGAVTNSDIVALASILVRNVEVELSEELEAQMIADFRKQLNDEDRYINVRNYFGIFGGCEVAVITPAEFETAAMVYVDAAGYWFAFPGGATALYVYKDSQFLRIDKAYDAGWLTAEDVGAIWDLLGG
ncbi:MAG: hypothetical protein E7456_05410 [Ruminococcaceae bacterium]|nr:hypothetical protein [Oscillospiraceae bacterium]